MIKCFPYRVENIICSFCDEDPCICTKEDKAEKKRIRHVNPNKPHRSDLCHKCKAGRPCQTDNSYDNDNFTFTSKSRRGQNRANDSINELTDRFDDFGFSDVDSDFDPNGFIDYYDEYHSD